MEPEFVDEERIPLIGDDDYDDSFYDDAEQAETSFGGDDALIHREALYASIRQREANIEAMNVQINALERNFNVKIPREQRARFQLSNSYLQVENDGNYINLTKSNGEFLAASTLRSRLGTYLARTLLGIVTPKTVKTRSRLLLDAIPTEIEMEDLSPDRIEKVIDGTTRAVNTDLDMREFLGIDKALTRIKGELENNTSKLTELDEQLNGIREELKNTQDPLEQEELNERLRELKQEREVRLEILSQNKKELASQFARIRQTVEKILDEDLTLREKIKLVFREHGLTIIAVLTSLGLVVSTIIGFLGWGGAATANPPKQPNKLKEWIKKKLRAFARLLGRLAGKAAAALPGIIGSIVAGILNFFKKAVVAASQHVWLFLTSIGTLVAYRIMYPPRK